MVACSRKAFEREVLLVARIERCPSSRMERCREVADTLRTAGSSVEDADDA